ncbi:hypothetical protein Tco_1008827 [Tanacetum coccineum]
MKSQSETTQTVSALKLPVLKTGDYDLWSMRMEQYLTYTDYALWEVIMNGDAPAIASASAGTEGPIPPKTAKQKLARKNEFEKKKHVVWIFCWANKESKKMPGGRKKTYSEAAIENFEDTKSEVVRSLYQLVKLQTLKDVVFFVSSKNTSSTNEAVNIDHEVSMHVHPQLDNEELEQIDTDDLEEMNLKWAPRNQGNKNGDNTRRVVPVETPANALVVTDRMGYDWRYQAEVGPTKFALMAHSSSGSSSSSSSDTEVHTCSKECLQSYQSLQKQYDQQHEVLNKANLEIIVYQMGLDSLEARIVVHQKNEAIYEEDIAFLKYDVKVRDNSIKELKNQLDEALKEKDDLKLKLEKFETSSKKLTNLINSQLSINNKTGVGFDSQMNKNELHDIYMNKSEVFESASDSSVNESEEENNQVNYRYKADEGYHAVPPLYTGNFMPPRPDMSFAGLDDFVFKYTVSETITSVHESKMSASKTSKESMKKPKFVRSSAPFIEDWESNSDDDYVIRPSVEQNKPSYAKINFVKSNENTGKSVIEQHTYRQAENLKKS